jgi:hypothetical protein
MVNIRRLSEISSIGQRRKAVSLLLAVLVMMTPSLYGTPRVHAATSVVTFTSPNPEPNGEFGWSVAISGNIVVVGAPGETVAGFAKAGRAYIFSSEGSLIATLTSPNPQTNGPSGRFTPYGAPLGFGYAVGVSGTIVVVGAPGETTQAGHAYICSTTGCPATGILTSPNTQANGFFGDAVGVSGTNVVVGAQGEAASAAHAYLCNSGGAPQQVSSRVPTHKGVEHLAAQLV